MTWMMWDPSIGVVDDASRWWLMCMILYEGMNWFVCWILALVTGNKLDGWMDGRTAGRVHDSKLPSKQASISK